MKKTVAVLGFWAVCCSCGNQEEPAASSGRGGDTMILKVTSSAFKEGEMIPARYTADGEDISPPLSWEGLPEGTRSVAIIADDPDAPAGTWVHWLVWNLPPTTHSLSENVPADNELPGGGVQGTTSFGTVGYGGPAPPSGTHRYYFRVYALDEVLALPSTATRKELERAMEGHILAKGQLMGRYARK